MWGVACASRLSGGLRSILSVDSPIWHNAVSKPSVHFLALNRMSTVSKFATSRNQIAGIAVTELAEKFGTPVYVYDQQVIDRRIADLADFDVVRYAQKASGNLAVLDRMRKQGVEVDAVSAGEIRRAMAAGYSADPGKHDIVYTADIFDREALELVVKHSLPVNCGSPDMISQLGERRPGADVTLRINPGFGHGHSQKTNTGGQQSIVVETTVQQLHRHSLDRLDHIMHWSYKK